MNKPNESIWLFIIALVGIVGCTSTKPIASVPAAEPIAVSTPTPTPFAVASPTRAPTHVPTVAEIMWRDPNDQPFAGKTYASTYAMQLDIFTFEVKDTEDRIARVEAIEESKRPPELRALLAELKRDVLPMLQQKCEQFKQLLAAERKQK